VAENGTLDLVGTYEAHLILGVERSRLARWIEENREGKAKIADPVARLKCGPIWRREQIEAKLAELAGEAGVGPDDLDTWAVERSLSRARQMKPPMPPDELESIIRRRIPTPA
jgi:hypothetical protein